MAKLELSELEWFIKPHKLGFNFNAKTSRGEMASHQTYIITVVHKKTGIHAYGEVAPLKGLSKDFTQDIEKQIHRAIVLFSKNQLPETTEEVLEFVSKNIPRQLPSLRFGFETLFLDLLNCGQQLIFVNDFYTAKYEIPINGLIWMAERHTMEKQIIEKIKQGFDCIKMKIGAINISDELHILKHIRKKYDKESLTLRVDANGAFDQQTALNILEKLADLDVHSIEQPIAPGQWQAMKQLSDSKFAQTCGIVLDEELILIDSFEKRIEAIKRTAPQYLVLKPQMLGGFKETAAIINYAIDNDIPWWITSALESNIGLNAICQFTGNYKAHLAQGLGTGSLYSNNFKSPLIINKGRISYNDHLNWVFNVDSL